MKNMQNKQNMQNMPKMRWDQAYGGSDQAWGQIKMKIYQILIQLSELIILTWDQSFGGTDQALGQINMWILYNFHPNIPNTRPGCHRCLTSSWAYMYLESPCTHAPKNSDPSLLGTVIRRHLVMVHTVHSVLLSIFRARGPPDSMLSSCDPPFWCHGFLIHGDI